MTENKTAKRGRKPKFTEEQARERMIATAVEELLRTGLSLGLQSVRLDRVLVLAEVPRGSAYAAFEDGELSPQENLRSQTVRHILTTTTGNNAGPTREATLELIDSLADDINSNEIERRRAARAEIARVISAFNQDRLDSSNWRLYRAISFVLATQAETHPSILAAIEEGEQRLVDTYSALLREFAEIMRMSLKPGRTFEMLAKSMIALNDGLSNHQTEAFGSESQRFTGPDGNEWTLYALGVEALYDAFLDFT